MRLASARRGGDRARCPSGEPTKTTQIIAIYGKGGIGKSFTLANLSYMMAQQGKTRAADRLRSQERHHVAAVRRPQPARPSSRRRPRRSSPARRCRSATSASSATACSRWSSAVPRSAAAAAGAASSTASNCWRSSASTNGASTTCCWTSSATWSAAASACRSRATCARRSSSSASNDLQSLYVANNVCSAVEYFRKLGGNVGVAGMVINKDDGTGRGAGVRRQPSAFRCWRRSRPTTTSAARAPITRSSAGRAVAGRRCSRQLAQQGGRCAAGAARRR